MSDFVSYVLDRMSSWSIPAIPPHLIDEVTRGGALPAAICTAILFAWIIKRRLARRQEARARQKIKAALDWSPAAMAQRNALPALPAPDAVAPRRPDRQATEAAEPRRGRPTISAA